MKEVGEIELAIQGQTEEIEQLGMPILLEPDVDLSADHVSTPLQTGEAGKVEESMAKLEAVEALKSEKAEKEVMTFSIGFAGRELIHLHLHSENCSDFPKRVVLQVIKSFVSVKPVAPTCQCSTLIVDWPTTSVVK
jgi:hypothetical protein